MSTVVITGASSGIGAALARAYAKRGARVVLIARREERLRQLAELVEQEGGSALVLPADLSSEAECQRIVDALAAEAVDVLIHNAGRGNYAAVEDTPTDQWRSIFALNVDAPFFLTRGLLPAMKQRGSGHIVTISSTAGTQGFPYNAAYVAAKHAVLGFTAGLRAELVVTDVHATIVCPAGVVTEWGDVTEGGSINDLYGAAIPRSRTIARDRDLSLAPLSKMMSADDAAAIIMQAVDHGRNNHVFTHDGTRELAVRAVTDSVGLEDEHTALWLAMREAYEHQ